mgnify:CR=1 FL=1
MLSQSSQSTDQDIQPHASAEQLLAFCKASADHLRLNILRILSRDSFAVSELCRIVDYKQSGLSHHLKILATAGLVTTRREGNTIFYRRATSLGQPNLKRLQQQLFIAIDQLPLPAHTEQRLHDLQRDRATRSQAFFTSNAGRFRQQQEQIAAYELYGRNAAELVTNNTTKGDTVLEVGPGEGAFLSELSDHFGQVYALDNSQAMLDIAKQQVEKHNLSNVQLLHGDTKTTALTTLHLDCIVINMVLHHTPSPAEIFSDLGALLKKNGQLFVTDLCRHDQSWVQDACGDLWLGFEPEDLSDWAASAGLVEGQSVYLTQLNGFRVQIRQFLKQ